MKSFLTAMGLIGCLSGWSSLASAEETKHDFKLMNKTGYELKELYVSPSKSSDWQDDVLEQATFDDGQFACPL